jgi:hypothetical protein
MTAMKVAMVAACVLVLGFDLARDGAEKIRLKRSIEVQKETLGRQRLDLSTSRSMQQVKVFEMVWGVDRENLDNISLEQMEEMALVDETQVSEFSGSVVPISVLDHLLAEEDRLGK